MEQFRCPGCQAEFSTADQLRRHMKQHTNPAEERPEHFRSADQAERSRSERSPMDYRCPRCGAEFSTREELDRHGRAQHLME